MLFGSEAWHVDQLQTGSFCNANMQTESWVMGCVSAGSEAKVASTFCGTALRECSSWVSWRTSSSEGTSWARSAAGLGASGGSDGRSVPILHRPLNGLRFYESLEKAKLSPATPKLSEVPSALGAKSAPQAAMLAREPMLRHPSHSVALEVVQVRGLSTPFQERISGRPVQLRLPSTPQIDLPRHKVAPWALSNASRDGESAHHEQGRYPEQVFDTHVGPANDLI